MEIDLENLEFGENKLELGSYENENNNNIELKDNEIINPFYIKSGESKLNDIEKTNFNKTEYYNIQLTSLMINPEGLFYILSKSTKPLAKLFMNKYITEIMPSITNTGKYISSKNDQQKINKLCKKLTVYL